MVMKRNIKLKVAIWDSQKTQSQIAAEAGVNRTYLSLALNGKFILSDNQKIAIARVLGCEVEKLFQE